MMNNFFWSLSFDKKIVIMKEKSLKFNNCKRSQSIFSINFLYIEIVTVINNHEWSMKNFTKLDLFIIFFFNCMRNRWVSVMMLWVKAQLNCAKEHHIHWLPFIKIKRWTYARIIPEYEITRSLAVVLSYKVFNWNEF